MSVKVKSHLRREDQQYTACYCEENIYMILHSRSQRDPNCLRYFTVVFLSNPSGYVPVFAQRAASDPSVPMFWDYHVILVEARREAISEEGKEEAVVYDLDTTIPSFPTPFPEYFTTTLRPATSTDEYVKFRVKDPMFRRYMRLVPGDVFLKKFASSRVHMLREGKEGDWFAEPPVWDVISGEEAEGEHTLPRFLDFSKAGEGGDDGYGRIVDEGTFWREFMGEREMPKEDLEVEIERKGEALS